MKSTRHNKGVQRTSHKVRRPLTPDVRHRNMKNILHIALLALAYPMAALSFPVEDIQGLPDGSGSTSLSNVTVRMRHDSHDLISYTIVIGDSIGMVNSVNIASIDTNGIPEFSAPLRSVRRTGEQHYGFMIQKRFVETGVIDIMTDTSHYRLQLKTLNDQ